MKNFNKNKQKVALLLDRIISVFIPQKQAKTNIPIKKIVIFDFHLIGDIVLLTAFLKSLRLKYNNQYIVLVAGSWSKDILSNHPHLIDKIIYFNAPWVIYQHDLKTIINLIKLIKTLRAFHFDIGIEMRGDMRQLCLMYLSNVKNIVGYRFTGGKNFITHCVPDDGVKKHLIDYHKQISKYLGCSTKNYIPQLWLSEKEWHEIRVNKKNNKRCIIGIHPGASLPLKMMPVDKISNIIKKLSKLNYDIIIFQGPKEKGLVENIVLKSDFNGIVFKGSLKAYILKLASCNLVISMDSSCGHIAASIGIPVVVIFGPSPACFSHPIGNSVVNIQLPDNKVPCRPCDQKRCVHPIFKYCLSNISEDTIISKIMNILK